MSSPAKTPRAPNPQQPCRPSTFSVSAPRRPAALRCSGRTPAAPSAFAEASSIPRNGVRIIPELAGGPKALNSKWVGGFRLTWHRGMPMTLDQLGDRRCPRGPGDRLLVPAGEGPAGRQEGGPGDRSSRRLFLHDPQRPHLQAGRLHVAPPATATCQSGLAQDQYTLLPGGAATLIRPCCFDDAWPFEAPRANEFARATRRDPFARQTHTRALAMLCQHLSVHVSAEDNEEGDRIAQARVGACCTATDGSRSADAHSGRLHYHLALPRWLSGGRRSEAVPTLRHIASCRPRCSAGQGRAALATRCQDVSVKVFAEDNEEGYRAVRAGVGACRAVPDSSRHADAHSSRWY